jgi:hypothetical protein
MSRRTYDMAHQWCRDCFRYIPKHGWKESAWNDITKTCRTCTNNYKRTTRNPHYREELKALKAEIRRAIQLERDTLRREVQEVKRQVREETREARYFEREFRRSCRNLGLDPDYIWKLYQAHDGTCQICTRHEDELRTRLCIDHCHDTGAFRGFLCDTCNSGLGFLGDSYEGIKRALEYLHRS